MVYRVAARMVGELRESMFVRGNNRDSRVRIDLDGLRRDRQVGKARFGRTQPVQTGKFDEDRNDDRGEQQDGRFGIGTRHAESLQERGARREAPGVKQGEPIRHFR